MSLSEAIPRAQESAAAAALLAAAVELLATRQALSAAAWLDPEGAELRTLWPGDQPLSQRLQAQLAAAARAGARRLGPEQLEDGPGEAREALLVRLGEEGTLALVAPPGALEADRAAWERLGAALGRAAAERRTAREVEAIRARLGELEEERIELCRRVEEGEVLHTLGLAVNRSLDPGEVLHLVARFTRTALGASYVTVCTGESARLETVASIGLPEGTAWPDEDPLGRAVVAAGKPVRVGVAGADAAVELGPHATLGMKIGLGVPLSLYGETFGALVIGYRREQELDPRHVRLALTLAGHAAVALGNARLHRALAERTRELERAYDELRGASQAKERFFAALSHELRTPLNAILGYQSLILDGVVGDVPAAIGDFIAKGNRAAEGLLDLVNNVLDLSKIEAGKMDLAVQPVRPRDLVEDALATVQPLAASKGLPLVFSPADPPEIRTDPARVRQILVNLLSNAIKFTDHGSVAVELEADLQTTADPPRLRRLEVRIRDTGPGIPEEDRERIFQEFEQVRGPAAHRGTGLGLPISRKLARLLGGELSVRSTPGTGSTFTLSLPGTPPASDLKAS